MKKEYLVRAREIARSNLNPADIIFSDDSEYLQYLLWQTAEIGKGPLTGKLNPLDDEQVIYLFSQIEAVKMNTEKDSVLDKRKA